MAYTPILIGIILLAGINIGLSIRYCQENTDCEDLGGLSCVKSMCTWGICGCSRGYAARFIGTVKKYQCVKIKKIGDKCSTDDTEGVCGAENSKCKDNRCQCDPGTESRWGGETCLIIKKTTISESCSAGIGTCDSGSTCRSGLESLSGYTAMSLMGLTNSPFDEVPNTCDCGAGYTAALSNNYGAAASMGKMGPMCRANRVRDVCFRDMDCSMIRVPTIAGGWTTGQAQCVNNKCVCPTSQSTYKPDITGLYCAQGLKQNQDCAWGNDVPDSNVGVCDGTSGLRCGDPCDVVTFGGHGNHTCVCDPGWTKGSGACSRKNVGDSCYGDHNCKSIAHTAVCTDGLCQNTAVFSTWSMVTILSMTVFHIIQ